MQHCRFCGDAGADGDRCVPVAQRMAAGAGFGSLRRTAYAQNQELEETYRSGYDLEEIERKALALGLVPVEQVQHIRMQVELPAQKVEEPSFWEEMTAFFAGIFA